MKLFNEAHREKAVEHIRKAMKATDEESWTASPFPTYMGFVGWLDGHPMCPNNRAAFVETWGEEVTKRLEDEAKKRNAEADVRRETSHYAAYMREAVANAGKLNGELVAGDFISLVGDDMKCCGSLNDCLWSMVNSATEDAANTDKDYQHIRSRLCKITRIVDVPADYFNGDQLHLCVPIGNEGGCQSDDIPDEADKYNLTQEQLNTFYSLVVMYRDVYGRAIFVDFEGYSYPRYVFFRANWREMFAPHIAEIQTKIALLEKIQAEEAAAKEAAARAEYDARCAKWSSLMAEIPSDAEWSIRLKMIKANIHKMAKTAFPKVRFSIRREHGWGKEYVLTWTGGPTEKEVLAATDFKLFVVGHDTFDGYTDCTGYSHEKYIDFAKKFGKIDNGVRLYRKVA